MTDIPWRLAHRPNAVIHFRESGCTGPPVVLLHGQAGHSGEWLQTMRHLSSRYRTLALDQLGHGRSTRVPRDLSREAFADDVAAVITTAAIDPPVVLIGQSMGAHTAFITASRHPDIVSHLAMFEGDVGGGGNDELDSLRAALASWPVPFPDGASALAFFGGDTEVDRAWTDGLEQRADGLWPRWDIDVMLRTMKPIFTREFWPEWEALPHPTLLVLGERSWIDAGRIKRMLALRPATRCVSVAGASHDVHLEQRGALLRALDAFLA